MRLRPANPRARYNLGLALAQGLRDLAGGRAAFEEAVALDPAFFDGWRSLAKPVETFRGALSHIGELRVGAAQTRTGSSPPQRLCI